MQKNMNKLLILLGTLLLFVLTGSSVLLLREQWQEPDEATRPNIVSESVKEISYEGREGRSALSLLQEKTSVKQDESGLVVKIGGYEADAGKREFWAFYVNGKMATVGSAEYITQKGERIQWKIETY